MVLHDAEERPIKPGTRLSRVARCELPDDRGGPAEVFRDDAVGITTEMVRPGNPNSGQMEWVRAIVARILRESDIHHIEPPQQFASNASRDHLDEAVDQSGQFSSGKSQINRGNSPAVTL
jgi:hypothetical protein